MNSKKKRAHWYILVECLLCMGLLALSYSLIFKRPSALGMQGQAQANMEKTKTALAGTANALLGPFPTATFPTRTPSSTVTVTPILSATPTLTPSVTRTPTSTPAHMVNATPTRRSFNLLDFLLGLSSPATRTPTLRPSTPTLSHPTIEPPAATNTDAPPPTNTDSPVEPPPPTDPPVEPPPPTDPPVEPPPPTDPPAEPPPPTEPPAIP